MIHGVSSTSALAGRLNGTDTSGSIATQVMGEMGSRAAAWVARLSGSVRADDGFRPDTALLARGGDIYGIGEVSRDIAAHFGAGPADEGALHRAIEDFTREAVVASAVLADRPGQAAARIEAAIAGVADASSETIDGVVTQLEQATATLRR
jgi:hypothetical protein